MNKGMFFLTIIGISCVLYLMICFGSEVFITPEPQSTNYEVLHDEDVYTDYEPHDFRRNYSIDLKQDGYLILDEQGEVWYVPFNELEEWFLKMNL